MIWFTSTVFLCLFSLLPWRYHAAGQSNDLLSLSSYRLIAENGFSDTETAAENSTGQMDEFRLPNEVIPVSYALDVATDFANLSFSGRVEIVVRSMARTCKITMNAKDLDVTDIEVIDYRSNMSLPVVDYHIVDRNEQLIVVLNDTSLCLIPTRWYTLKITYGAFLRDDMSGYYKSSYRENNEIKYGIIDKIKSMQI